MKNIPITNAQTVWQLWLDGAADLVAVWDMLPEDRYQYDNQRRALNSLKHSRFFGVSNESEARKVLLEGYPYGARLVTDLATKVSEKLPPPKSRRRVRKWRDDGDELSMERLQAGHDTCWRSMHRQLKSACGLIEVVVGWGSDCGASQERLQWSGAAALALTDLLEKADYSVELALIAAMEAYDNHQNRTASLVRVDLKRMGELVDIEQLAAVAVYPPAWRLYGLCAFQQGPYSSGGSFNGHPHSHFQAYEPNGMWNYRPNVMTLVLPESSSESGAQYNVLEALKSLESLVNPQDAE